MTIVTIKETDFVFQFRYILNCFIHHRCMHHSCLLYCLRDNTINNFVLVLILMYHRARCIMQLTNYDLESQTTGYNYYFTPKAVLYNTHRRHVNEMRIIKLSR